VLHTCLLFALLEACSYGIVCSDHVGSGGVESAEWVAEHPLEKGAWRMLCVRVQTKHIRLRKPVDVDVQARHKLARKYASILESMVAVATT